MGQAAIAFFGYAVLQIGVFAVAAAQPPKAWTPRDSPYLSAHAMQKLALSGVAKEHQRMLNLARPLAGAAAGGPSVLGIADDFLRGPALPESLALCGTQAVYALKSLREPWASRMVDAYGKPQDGLLEGNLYWPGDFDECMAVTSNGNGNLSFTGQYCKVSMPLSLGGQQANLQIGICVPSGCQEDDVEVLTRTGCSKMSGYLIGDYFDSTILTGNIHYSDEIIFLILIKHNNSSKLTVECHGLHRSLSPRAVFTVVVCTIFALCLIVGTAYEAATLMLADAGHVSIIKYARSLVLNDDVSVTTTSNRVDSEGNEQSESSALLSQSDKSPRVRVGGIYSRLLLSFSVYSNGKKLFSTSQPESSSLGCLNGIRFLSMCWVILGHTYVYSINDADNPATFLTQTVRRTSFQFMVNGTVCVDSFFLLSGLLVTYLLLKEVDKKNGKLRAQEWVMLYVHRYLRLTAPYALLLMIWTCLAVYIYDGPSWPTNDSMDPICDNYWWTNLLYINNFVPGATGADLSCMGWSWYLANDMQFYIVTPLIVWLLYRCRHIGKGQKDHPSIVRAYKLGQRKLGPLPKFKYAGIGLTVTMVIASTVSSAVVSVRDNFQVGPFSAQTSTEKGVWFADYYTKPWIRFAPYGVGILLGYVLHRMTGKSPLRPLYNLSGWAVSTIFCLSVLYGPYEVEAGSRSGQASAFEAAAYNSLFRPVWAIGLGWVIFACSTQNGGWVNTLLSWKAFGPLARLTYCGYLIHPMILIMAEYGARATFPYDDITMTLRFFGVLLCGMAAAVIASLAFEAPLMNLEKVLLQSGRSRNQK